MTDRRYYLDTFKVTEEQMGRLVAEALAQGGDYADLYFEYTTYNDLLLRDGEVSSGGFHIDFGVGIRVLKGERTGYAYSENTGMTDMLAAARAAAMIAGGQARKQVERAASGMMGNDAGRTDIGNAGYGGTDSGEGWQDLYPMCQSWRSARAEEFLPFLKSLEQKITAKDGRVTKVIARLSDSQSDIMMFNSEGELTCDTRPLGSITASVIFCSGGKTENKTVSRSFRAGAEMVTEELIDEMAAEAVAGIDERFEAKRPKGGQMPVVMGAGASGILLHEAMGHSFEADFNRKGQSIFSGRTGEKICDSSISIVDDGTIAGNRGACNFDDEGIPGQKTYMVKDGILNSYLHDRISAKWFGVSPTGNGRRESFRFNPIPRMRATYMENGNASRDDIISSVKKGIYVDEFSNGQVKIGEGDFTFYVKSGRLIENGRLTAPVKDINIIGNGPQALADIIAVGNDLKIDNGPWTCGKDQSAAVSCGIPTVLVRSLTVGGN